MTGAYQSFSATRDFAHLEAKGGASHITLTDHVLDNHEAALTGLPPAGMAIWIASTGTE